MTRPPGPSRTVRLAQACEVALARCEAKGMGSDVFAELGETLFWLVALAEANDHKRDPEVLGLSWARDRITHGVIVTAPVAWHYGSELPLVLGAAELGTTSGHEWLPRSAVPVGPADQPHARKEAAYDDSVAGRQVAPLIREVLAKVRRERGYASDVL